MSVSPVADPTVGNLATPVNSNYFTKAFLNALPIYRPSLSPNRRGLEIGMTHGYLLYGPFAVCGPLRNSDYASTAGLLASIGLVSILTVCLSIYGTAGNGPKVQPADATINNPPSDLFTKEGWSEFASGFWLGGCGGAAFAWFLVSATPLLYLAKIAGGVAPAG
ncbi:photosystem I reaction centre subunit XI [Synechococcus sp. BIOS-E4-1]|uniref:photosystem I reaction center subunit XI n=1 Tax=unclassified Synechococcus TaxID=2626047 RepID=UPI0007BB8073|nr:MULTISPECIES: photosystem I reaction center subunit XI [unclassified Synechococcus]KZR86300.1 Photosystem I reaction center subunit XI [Synechococcus sp. MIT S9504]KZR93562.1 Photosystem I reaction center subunit XI [Synechococcus sp. MIT S9509]QNI53067.1 photosystem I reaction centre subunit XI [Synechococcus sp. BIOS-E4-1]